MTEDQNICYKRYFFKFNTLMFIRISNSAIKLPPTTKRDELSQL